MQRTNRQEIDARTFIWYIFQYDCTRICLWFMFHLWLTQGHVCGTFSTAGWQKDMNLEYVPMLTVPEHASGTCSTAGWHMEMYLVHVLLLADTWTCLRYMFNFCLTHEHVSGTCSTAGWHKEMSLDHVPLMTDTWSLATCSTGVWLKDMSLVHVPLLSDTSTCLWTCSNAGWILDMFLNITWLAKSKHTIKICQFLPKSCKILQRIFLKFRGNFVTCKINNFANFLAKMQKWEILWTPTLRTNRQFFDDSKSDLKDQASIFWRWQKL